MAYTKQTWHDGEAGNTPINAARLQHIEDGIGDLDGRVGGLANAAPGQTFTVIYDGTNWWFPVVGTVNGGVIATSRPTPRTDLVMECINPVGTSQPAWAIDGDVLLIVS